jgi:hypothetical protein
MYQTDVNICQHFPFKRPPNVTQILKFRILPKSGFLSDLVLADVGQPVGDEQREQLVDSGNAVPVADFLQGQLGAVQAGQAGQQAGECALGAMLRNIFLATSAI